MRAFAPHGADGDVGETTEAERKKKEASSHLLKACEDGDVEAAKKAIQESADVHVRDWEERCPLMSAADPCCGNSLEIVQMLIGAGCDVNQADDCGWTALNSVVLDEGRVSIVEALLRGGADRNIASRGGFTSCHCANSSEVLKLLLNAGVDPRKENSDGMTPSHYRQLEDGDVGSLRPIYEAWTPHRMLPKWTPSSFPLYVEQCSGFKSAIITLLSCLRRYRHIIPKDVGKMIIEYVAEMHRKEMWWPSYQDFDMEPYM